MPQTEFIVDSKGMICVVNFRRKRNKVHKLILVKSFVALANNVILNRICFFLPLLVFGKLIIVRWRAPGWILKKRHWCWKSVPLVSLWIS